MFDDSDDARKQNTVYWGLHVFHAHPDLFACWVAVDETNTPWAIGLSDEDFDGAISIYGRHVALITSPVLTLKDLPACRTHFQQTPRPASAGLCLTVEHYSGMHITFHQHADGSGAVYFSVQDGCEGYPLHVTVPYSVITEYLACTDVDPTRWHERPGWVRNPRPFNEHEAVYQHYRETGDLDMAWQLAATDQWFDTVKEELARRWIVATR
jgi:hypothetical protein